MLYSSIQGGNLINLRLKNRFTSNENSRAISSGLLLSLSSPRNNHLVFHWMRRGGCCAAARCCGGSLARAGSCFWSGKGRADPRGRPWSPSWLTAAGETAAAPCGTSQTCGSIGDVLTVLKLLRFGSLLPLKFQRQFYSLNNVQGDYVEFNTGNGENLSYSQAEPGQASCFPVA